MTARTNRWPKLSRRGLILGATATGGLVALAGAGALHFRRAPSRGRDLPTDPTLFLHLAEDDTVTLLTKHLEMGQGIATGLATLVAEELGADWAQIQVIQAPADRDRFFHAY